MAHLDKNPDMNRFAIYGSGRQIVKAKGQRISTTELQSKTLSQIDLAQCSGARPARVNNGIRLHSEKALKTLPSYHLL